MRRAPIPRRAPAPAPPLPILSPALMAALPEIHHRNPNPAGHPPRLFRMVGDAMAPELRRGDHLLVVPISAYHCEGLYLLSFGPGHVALYRCEVQGRDRIRAWKDNPTSGMAALLLTRAEFEDAVLGQVAMTLRTVAGGLMPEPVAEGVVA